jgi:hypothetical protein
MLILLPVIFLVLTALVLVILRFTQPTFRYPWMVAVAGGTFALIFVFFWHIRLPQSVSIVFWQPVTVFPYSLSWVADGVSWPYALSLATLASAVIWTSVVRIEYDPLTWAGTLLVTALGILAVAAENPITLVLTWSAVDLAELITMLRSTVGEDENKAVLIAFSARVTGTGLVLLAYLITLAGGSGLNFQSIPSSAGIYLLIAAGLRLGVLPLHLPYQRESDLLRGFGTTLRLVSAAASLSLLARLPASALSSSLVPFLLILAAIAALYAGWLWLRASDELLGRPFWVLGLASLSVAACLRGNPTGSIGWGTTLILSGGLLFLFSARQRSILWLPLLALVSFSTLPYSTSASAWLTANNSSWFFIIIFIPAQALLMAGYVRHSLHPGETSLESHARWTKVLYPTGLLLLEGIAILLGLWGWDGSRSIGIWWAALVSFALATGFSALALILLPRLALPSVSTRWTHIFRLEWFFTLISAVFRFFHGIADMISSSLEGEGGLLWSLTLLVLILSVLSTWGR